MIDKFALELDAFSSAILERKNVAPDGQQGHGDMVIIHAIHESARNLRPVNIRYSSEARSHGA